MLPDSHLVISLTLTVTYAKFTHQLSFPLHSNFHLILKRDRNGCFVQTSFVPFAESVQASLQTAKARLYFP